MIRTDKAWGHQRKRAKSVAWIIAAIGFLVAGVLTGAVLGQRAGDWALPVAGFVGYVLAFRRGMLARDADKIWRDQGDEEDREAEDLTEAAKMAPEEPSRSRQAMRIVR